MGGCESGSINGAIPVVVSIPYSMKVVAVPDPSFRSESGGKAFNPDKRNSFPTLQVSINGIGLSEFLTAVSQ